MKVKLFIISLLLSLAGSAQDFKAYIGSQQVDAAYIGSHNLIAPDTLNITVALGQSQPGVDGSTNASLTTGTKPRVYTLTDGPLDPNTSTGQLVLLQAGDVGDNNISPTDNDVETYFPSALRYADTLVNSAKQHYMGFAGYYGGATLPTLIKGGGNSEEGWSTIHDGIIRGYEIAQDSGWVVRVFFWFSHGGTTSVNYSTTVNTLKDDMVTFVDSLDSTIPLYIFADQQRVVSPDVGLQIPHVFDTVSNAYVIGARQDWVETYDGVHMNPHGMRKLGVYGGYFMSEIIKGRDYYPMDIDTIILDGTIIKCHVENEVGTLVGAGDYDIEVYDVTNTATLAGTWAIDNDTLEFTISSPPVGTVTIEVRTDRGTGSLRDSRPNTKMGFEDSGASPYTLYQHLTRRDHSYSFTFAATAPSDITLTNSDIDENSTGTVGTLGSNGNPVGTFSIIGGTDQANFSVNGTDLDVDTSFDYETQTTAEVEIRVTNAGGSYDETLTIDINDVVEGTYTSEILVQIGNFTTEDVTLINGEYWNRYSWSPGTQSLVNEDNTASGVSMLRTGTWTGNSQTGGMSSSTNALWPDEVTIGYWYNDFGDVGEVSLSGLNANEELYEILVIGCRNGGSPFDRVTTATADGISDSYDAAFNTGDDWAVIALPSADANGDLIVDLENLNSGGFGYVSGLRIRRKL